MNAKTKLPPPLILSKSLSAYRLTKRHTAVLWRWDELRRYMSLANKPTTVVRLKAVDYADIDAAVRSQSGGKYSLSDINYEGCPILSDAVSEQQDAFA